MDSSAHTQVGRSGLKRSRPRVQPAGRDCSSRFSRACARGRRTRLIPSHLRSGRILDVGCGSYPYFLAHTEFAEKFALDQAERPATAPTGVEWHTLDLHRVEHFPFPTRTSTS